MTRKRRRPWLAALLAFIYPGMGHAYLREWFRALLWFGLALTTAFVFIPPETFQAVESGGWSAYMEAMQNVPTRAVLPVLAVQLLNIVDAYWSALRNNRAAASAGPTAEAGETGKPEGSDETGGYRCPECGREVDEDLDFCQWCTARLDDATAR